MDPVIGEGAARRGGVEGVARGSCHQPRGVGQETSERMEEPLPPSLMATARAGAWWRGSTEVASAAEGGKEVRLRQLTRISTVATTKRQFEDTT